MLQNRIIPILTIINEDLVKTKMFDDPSYVGDPINAIKIFNEKFVDELILIDIGNESKTPNINFICDIASECFMPLTYGGKITSISQAEKIFNSGVEKISLNTLTYTNIDLVKNLVNIFGSSSIVGSIDYKIIDGKLLTYNKNSKIEFELDDHINKLIDCGVGEILLTSVQLDGTLMGYDKFLIEEISDKFDIPIVYNGGINSVSDIKQIFLKNINAVAVGAYFVYYGPHRAVLIHYPDHKQIKFLNEKS